ncbi:glycyl-radical enzyme activating protein [Candidatus Bipolaricaulota bacterium]|nr:glycyl-radical enzyme activating protein [Candidatus Bipolaricaulota bacterium]
MHELLVTKIQRFSIHDGPGIRTTVFLKGCNLKCPWCCNPENIKPQMEIYFKKGDCIECFECVKRCNFLEKPEDIFRFPEHFECVEPCPTGALGIYGEKITTKKLLEILTKDIDYYNNTNGGVTFSGGEPLLQSKAVKKVIKKLKPIHIAIETSLFAPEENLKDLLKDTDLFIVDVKILNHKIAQKTLQGNLKTFYKNFQTIKKEKIDTIIRFPAVKPYTFNKENIKKLINFLQENNIHHIQILEIHKLGLEKYKSLNLKMKNFKKPAKNEIKTLKSKLNERSIKMDYLKI